MSKKRSYGTGFAQVDLFGAVPAQGVGGRQGKARPVAGGGGYLKNCGISNFQIPGAPPPDPRFTEIEKIGIGGPWLRLARRVGFDTFLEIWRAISDDEAVRHDGGRRMPKLREFSAYGRFQRNEYIRSLARSGFDPQQVQKLVQRNLHEFLSLKHIQGIMRGCHDRSDYEKQGERK